MLFILGLLTYYCCFLCWSLSFAYSRQLLLYKRFDLQQRLSHSYSKSLRWGLSVGSKKRYGAIKASLSSDSTGPASSIAPLKLESPVGQFLSEILISHPHLLPAAAEQQLEQLQIDRDAEKQKEDPSKSGTDLVLYR